MGRRHDGAEAAAGRDVDTGVRVLHQLVEIVVLLLIVGSMALPLPAVCCCCRPVRVGEQLRRDGLKHCALEDPALAEALDALHHGTVQFLACAWQQGN